MPRIAIFADIHGNPFALEAVIEDIAQANVDEVLVGGDLVGRGPLGSEVVKRIRGLKWPSVRGNHEDYLINFRHHNVPKAWLSSPDWSAARWMAAQLDSDDVRYIEALPFDLVSPSDDGLHLFHGSPRDNQEGLGPWLEEETLLEIMEEFHGELLVCAHTHRPFEATLPTGQTIVNVGSAGLPFNEDTRAQYVIFERDSKKERWRIERRAVEYDQDAYLRAFETSGFLAAGGCTSYLLTIEVKTAMPYLVPFLRWCDVLEHSIELQHLDAFLDFYDPAEGLFHFMEQLHELASSS